MNTGINLGSSLGTAVLGVILILGSFGTLTAGSEYDLAANHQINNHLLFEKFDLNLEVTNESSVNDIKSNSMKDAFNVVTALLIVGLISSLLMLEKIHKPCEHGVTTQI